VYTLVEFAVLAGLARGETLARIAAALGFTQPGLTKLLRGLERKAGVRLVERRGRRLALTVAGAHLEALGRPLLALEAEAEQGMAAFRAGHSGRVAVAATSTPGNYLLPAVIGAFLRDAPGADVVLAVTHLDETWLLLQAGQADVAVVAGREAPQPFVCEPLYDEPIVLFVGATHPLAAAPAPTWRRLAEETLVTSQSETTAQEMLRRLGAGRFAPAREIELRAVEGLKRLVETGFGLGLAFRLAVDRELRLGLLHEIAAPTAPATVPFSLAYRGDRAMYPMLARFMAAVRAAARGPAEPRADAPPQSIDN
jgi:DNA-binding transcriptional LysR family regulator